MQIAQFENTWHKFIIVTLTRNPAAAPSKSPLSERANASKRFASITPFVAMEHFKSLRSKS